LFSRVLAFYAMNYQEVRKLPVETFWMLNKNIDRIAAENDMRAAQIGIQVQSGEGFKDLMDNLRKQLGVVFTYDEGKRAMAAKRDKLNEEQKADLNALGDLSNVSTRRA
jgi:hypothetical protein